MAEKLNQTVNIPVWLFSLIIPLLFGLIVSVLTSQAEMKTNIVNIDSRLTKIENKL